MNEEELVKRLQIKDIMAFERLYEMYWENVFGVINAIVKDESMAEEISQEVFVKVWNNSDNYNPSKGRFFSWILNIARKTASDEVLTKSDDFNAQDLTKDYLSDVLNDKVQYNRLKDGDGLTKLAKNVGEKNIKIIDLLYFKGCTPQEAPDVLDIPLDKLKKKNRSGISQIRENITFEWI